MSNKGREERLKQLEQEREFFYRQKNISNSSTGHHAEGDGVDFTSIKQRLGIHSDGRQFFSTPSSKSTEYKPNNEISEKLPSQKLVDDILNATKFDFSALDKKSPRFSATIFSQKPQKSRVDTFEKMVSKDHRARQKVYPFYSSFSL